MKKLKKSLKNNLLRINLKFNNSYFILKNTIKKDLIFSKSQTLTRSSVTKIGLNDLVDSTILKFPIILESFNYFEKLQNGIILHQSNKGNSSLILIKANNLIFNNISCHLLTQHNFNLQFLKLQNFLLKIVLMLVLIKKYLKSKNK